LLSLSLSLLFLTYRKKCVYIFFSPRDSIFSYRATLGHKVNNAFKDSRNTEFCFVNHPRFGHCRCIRSTKPIAKGEELFIDYGYSVEEESTPRFGRTVLLWEWKWHWDLRIGIGIGIGILGLGSGSGVGLGSGSGTGFQELLIWKSLSLFADIGFMIMIGIGIEIEIGFKMM
jgi:hypothetical protein